MQAMGLWLHVLDLPADWGYVLWKLKLYEIALKNTQAR